MAIANGQFGGSDNDSNSDSDSDSDTNDSALPGSTGQTQVGMTHWKSQHRRPKSAAAVVGFAQSGDTSKMSAHQIAPPGTTEHSVSESQLLSRRPNSAGAVVRFEEPGCGVRYEL